MNWKEIIKQAALFAIQATRALTKQTAITWDDAALDALEKLVNEYLVAIGPALQPQMSQAGASAATGDVRKICQEVAKSQGL